MFFAIPAQVRRKVGKKREDKVWKEGRVKENK